MTFVLRGVALNQNLGGGSPPIGLLVWGRSGYPCVNGRSTTTPRSVRRRSVSHLGLMFIRPNSAPDLRVAMFAKLFAQRIAYLRVVLQIECLSRPRGRE